MSMRYGASREEWDAFESLNLQDVLPWVADPTVHVSEFSNLGKQGKKHTKTPSIVNRHGKVAGILDWPRHITTQRDIIKWREDDRLGICMNGRAIKCFDIDVYDQRRAEEVEHFIREHLGVLGQMMPLRDRKGVGKRALLFRVADGKAKIKHYINIAPLNEAKNDGGVVEILSELQQFVVAGMHEDGERYRWPEGIPTDLNSIPVFDEEEIVALYHAMHKRFAPNAPYREWRYNHERVARARGQHETYSDDPAVQYMLDHDIVVDFADDGGVYVRCPWEHKHSPDSTKRDAAEFYPTGANGRATPGFKCLHAHSQGEPLGFEPTFVEFFDAIGYRGIEIAEEFEVTGVAQEITPANTRPKFTYKGRSTIIENTISNVTNMLRWEGGGFRVRYDSFKDNIIYRRVDQLDWSTLDDDTYTAIRIEFAKRGMETPSHETVQRAVSFVAREQSVDTAKEWLREQQWDGVPRIERFHTDVLGLTDTPYHRAVCEYIWTALAGRVLDPGCKADMVPILTGKQGLRKSSLVEALAPSPDQYTVVTLADRDENLARQLRGRMVVEWDELRGLNSREAESLKGWVSRRKDDWIPKFKEFGTTMLRRFILIGTANPSRFLNDPTGLRRWLPLKITKTIDVDYVLQNRNQLWAEARELWQDEMQRTLLTTQTGVKWQQAEQLGYQAQQDASIRDPWVDAVTAWYSATDGVGPWTTLEILNQACGLPISQINFGTQERLRRVMAFLHWEEEGDGRWSLPLA